MVEPLTALQEKVRYFLDEWPDHPGLLKILDLIASLLAMPVSTPLSKVWYPIKSLYNTNLLLSIKLTCFTVTFVILKALLGLQLLAGKAQTLQENDSKFFLKGKG